MNIFELRKQREHALAKADSIVKAAETAGRSLTEAESMDIDLNMKAVSVLNSQIKPIEKNNTISKMLQGTGGNSVLLIDGGRRYQATKKVVFGAEYPDAFYRMIQTGGREVSAALYEGSEGAGGYAVPITVDDQIVPLAPQEMAVRQLAMVIPTSMDIKIPQKGSFGVANAKAENSSFTEVDPTLSQITLSAYMAGIQETVSWELAQDVPAFQAFAVDDMLLAQQMYEENLYCNGTGSGEAQGLVGNVGSGYGPQEPDTNGNTVSITGILNLIGTLNEYYHPNASFLMARQTSIIIRKAQVQSNLFFPAFTTVNGQDYLFGYPVKYSAYMPAATRGNTPVIFGDFKRGYVIGDRGGSGINVKVLDQPLATQGQIVLLAYRRTDGRVRRSEALQSYVVAAS
jgi:HK97 family phage major capsid protein